MTDWNPVRKVGDHVSQPPFESLVATAGKRARRTRIITGVSVCCVLTAAGVSLAVARTDDPRTIGPAKAPSQGLPSANVDTSLPDGVRALPAPQAGQAPRPLAAGRYQVPLTGSLAFEVDLPRGTTADNDGLYLQMKDGILKVEAAGTAYGVPVDACHVQRIEPVGPTVQDLVTAIGKETVYRVSAPQPVDIDGAHGTYLEMRIPAAYDSTGCDGGQVGLPGNPDTTNNMPPGYAGGWWILDVDGQRVVAHQLCDHCGPGSTRDLTNAVRGITFTSTP